VVALGLNPLELAVNPSKTEWKTQNLNKNPALPFQDSTFDVVTNSFSVDYLTSPLEIFKELHRVTKPGGLVCMAFTNRCFPSKIVPVWAAPFTDDHHARIIGNYFHFSAPWECISVVDVSSPGCKGQRDPMLVVQARKAKE
jgi:ubiquinone/menaquinone biosynthesis C-methylase UbiE